MKRILLFALIAIPFMAFGQNAYDYYGEKVQLEAHYFQSKNIGKLQGDKKQLYQGMDIYNGFLVSTQSSGIITIYNIQNSGLEKEKQLKLSFFSKTANAYNVTFGLKKISDDDMLPLLYVSGNNGTLYVEQVEKKFKNVQCVQTISLQNTQAKNVIWAIDKENDFLYAFCTLKNGVHQILRFSVPEINESLQDVKLKSADALEAYTIEDYYQGKSINSANGIYINNGQMFITCGAGSQKDASRLLIWDIYGKMMRNMIDLSTATRDKLTSCSVYDGALFVQSQGSIYKLIF